MNKHQKLVQTQFLNDEEAVIRRLKQVYAQSHKDITGKIKGLDSSISALQAALKTVTDTDIGDLALAFLGKQAQHMTPAEAKETLQSMIQSKVYQKKYQQAIEKQVGGVLDKLKKEQYSTISEYLTECYDNGYIGTMFDLQGQGIPLAIPLDQEAMVRAVQLDSKISKPLYQFLGEDVDLLKRKIAAQVSRGISSGMTFQQVAQQLEGQTNIGYNRAVRIARTEGHRIQCQAGMDACHDAKAKGADVLKQWDSTMDKRTRESHALVDGEIRELDKPFSNGLMFPGDPDGGPGEVINCRCALLQRAKWALDDEELETLKKRAEYFGLDKAETFEEYKKRYLKASEVLTNDGNGGIISSKKYSPDYDTELAKKFGSDYYDEMHKLVVENPDETARDVFKKFECEIEVGDASYHGTAHATGTRIYVNGARDSAGGGWKAPFSTTFHESGHAIDDFTRQYLPNASFGARYYSSAYRNGVFPQTIKDEIQDLVKSVGEKIKAEFKQHAGDKQWFIDNGYMYRWQPSIPKYSKSFAYSAVEKMIKNSGSGLAIADLSDILEGATAGKIQCGYGHGVQYWRDRTYDGVPNGLATEAFAEMMSATFTNPESLAVIKKYLPKSYSVFQEMLDSLLSY